MKLRKIYLTQSRKDAKKITNIMIYLGALASLRENKFFFPIGPAVLLPACDELSRIEATLVGIVRKRIKVLA